MIPEKRKKEAKQNFSQYLKEGLLKKEKNETAKLMYLKNSDMSLKIANELAQNKLSPYI